MLSVIRRENEITPNEILISALNSPYSRVYQEDGKTTLDLYITVKNATILLEGLKNILVDGDANQS